MCGEEGIASVPGIPACLKNIPRSGGGNPEVPARTLRQRFLHNLSFFPKDMEPLCTGCGKSMIVCRQM
jgi:hypothetical protein